MELELSKVTALITRDADLGRELLIFEHPTAGFQLPAGTVEPDKSPEAAVLRETAEETGLTDVKIAAHLDTLQHPLAPDERMVFKRCLLQASPGKYGTLYKSIVLNRGVTVRVIGCEDDYVRVTYPQYALERGELVVVSSKTGWLQRQLLTDNVQRHLYHLNALQPTPTQWRVKTDGHCFKLFWVPLAHEIGLISGQQCWLDQVRDRLLPAPVTRRAFMSR